MITVADLERMDASLRVYDVDQGAWEQEPNGFEANARHVLTHLAKDLAVKDFTDEELVRTAIAPDSVQYGLRLGRWAGIGTENLASIRGRDEDARSKVETGLKNLPWGFACFVGATGLLAQHLHDLDHVKSRDEALHSSNVLIGSAARLLIHGASIQAHQIGFSLTEAFNDRLAHLRERFGIPAPSAGRPVTRGTPTRSGKVPGATLSPAASKHLQEELADIDRSETGPGSYR